ncbi:MAG: hypothetical protein ABR597_15070, partial [Bacteroidales bacterium]
GINYTGDYTPGDEVIQYFVDDYGFTLYTWTNDTYNQNNFTAEDFGNNSIWPIYDETSAVIPSSLDGADFAFIDVFGETQI